MVIKTAAKKAIEAALRKKRLRKLRKDQAKVTKVGVQLTSSMNRKARMKFVGSEVPRAVYPRIPTNIQYPKLKMRKGVLMMPKLEMKKD